MMNAPSYRANDPKGWGGDPRRGAALGRPTIQEAPLTFNGKLYVRHVRLDSGGYDRNGTYFGHGKPLYWIADADGTVDYMVRADDHAGAKKLALAHYPLAHFHR